MDRCCFLTLGVVVLSIAMGAAGCSSPSGRIVEGDEPALVGSRKAGAAVYRPTMAKALGELLAQYASEERAQGKRVVAFVGVENKTRDEIRDIREALNQTVSTAVTESRVFTLINQRFVGAALREIGRSAEDLFLGKPREEFKTVLGKDGMTPDFLLFARLTSMTTSAEDVKEVYYQLTLELVDSNTGETNASKSAEIRKEYTS